MGEIRTFRDDEILKPFLDAIPKRKISKVVRRALYDYFFKDQDKVMLEDEESYYIDDIKQNVVKVEEVKTPEPVREINFNMFDD